MPEVRYIAETLCSAKPLTHDQKLLFGSQLLTQCRRDYDVVYLPGESPINSHYPVDTCQHNIQEKRGADARQKRGGANEEGAALKKIKFRHYQPVLLHRPVAAEPHSPTTDNLPSYDIAQAGFVNQQHAGFDHNARVHARVSSDSDSSVGVISTVTPSLISACTTPDLELIDPRLLEPGVSGEGGITLANKVPNSPDELPSPSNHDEDTTQVDKTMVQSCKPMSSLCISGNAFNHEDARIVEPTASPGRAKPHADIAWADGSSLEDDVTRGDAPPARCARTPLSSTSPVDSAPSLAPKPRGRITPRYSSKSPNTRYISQADSLLAPGERNTLCQLKSQNLTWRQIMPHFPEKSHSSIQRHTRSLRKTRR
ncbi:hypothetical protein BJX99DRAFT_248609 [Aspergillus californicus]